MKDTKKSKTNVKHVSKPIFMRWRNAHRIEAWGRRHTYTHIYDVCNIIFWLPFLSFLKALYRLTFDFNRCFDALHSPPSAHLFECLIDFLIALFPFFFLFNYKKLFGFTSFRIMFQHVNTSVVLLCWRLLRTLPIFVFLLLFLLLLFLTLNEFKK